MRNKIQKWLDKGFRYAYHYREGGTLEQALTHRFIATNEKTAIANAQSTLYPNPQIKVWDLLQELENY